MVSSDSSSSPFLENVTSFVSENRRALLLGAAAVVAAGGVGYYVYSQQASEASEKDLESGERKKKKKTKGSKKRLDSADGPLLEERKPKEDIPPADAPTSAPVSEKVSEEDVAAMSTEERTKLAASLKAKGNAAYQQRQFPAAADLYTEAIKVTPKPEAVFYSNRAACYVNFTPPQYERVVEDCDSALKIDAMYIKALNRRAAALEALDRNEEALRDFTAATIIDKFQNETAALAVERVLKKIATKKTEESLNSREKRLPSYTFISAYLAAFRPRAQPTLPETPTQADETLLMAYQALEANDYPHALSLVNEALTQEPPLSWDVGRAEAYNLRGTFKFLVGDSAGAKEDFEESLKILPSFTQSWVKIASVLMEQGDAEAAFNAFEQAIKHNPEDPDIYYHRGQVFFILGDFAKAAEDYQKSTNIDETFVFSHIQLAVAQYKSENIANSMATFRRTLKAFPQRSEPQNYYGELLLDQQRFSDAIDKFDRAIELEKAKPPPINVLPLVNKGLALFQWQQDVAGAERLCKEALAIDPECEAAVATLAQLSLQQGKVEEAAEMFGRHAELVRTEAELINAYTYKYASNAQLEFLKNYPELGSTLGALAGQMPM